MCSERQEEIKSSQQTLYFLWFKHACPLRFTVVLCVINTGRLGFGGSRPPFFQHQQPLSALCSRRPQVIFGVHSGPEAVFLPCARCPFCLRAGDLSRLNHRGTFSPHSSAYPEGKGRRISLQIQADFSIPSHLLDLFAERRPEAERSADL